MMILSSIMTLWSASVILLPLLFNLLTVGVVLLLIAGALAPFESLGWWAGWFGRPEEEAPTPIQEASAEGQEVQPANYYAVYLSGIGAIAGDYLEKDESEFLDRLEPRFPQMVLVRDVFPYAMNNRGLTGQRLFATVWRYLERLKLKGKGVLFGSLIHIRNIFQVAVSADLRYGPIYNYGTAEVIRDALLHRHYRIGSGVPVTLIGFSGGGQIAVGAANYLQTMMQAPIYIISVGGVMADDPGFARIQHTYHFYGSKDPIQRLGEIAYAGRWPILPYSPWNRAKAAGKITLVNIGLIGHNGVHGYFSDTSRLENGQTYVDHTVDVVAQALEATRT